MAICSSDAFVQSHPPSFNISAASVTEEAKTLVEATRTVCRHIVSRVTPETANFKNTIEPIAQVENARSQRDNFLKFFASTSPSGSLRQASQEATTILDNGLAALFSDRTLYLLVQNVEQNLNGSRLSEVDAESAHYVKRLRQKFTESGCGIVDDAERAAFVVKKNKIKQLAAECRNNLANEAVGLWLSRDELQGVQQSLIDRLRVGEGPHHGLLWLPAKSTFSVPVLTHARREATRKKIYYAVVNFAPQSAPILREMTLLRDETARMLGWPNHFAYKTSHKMMGSPEGVEQLLRDIRKDIEPVAERLRKELLNLKRIETQHQGDSMEGATVFFWDRQYFQRVLTAKLQPEFISVAEYFELNTTLQKLLELYEHLLGVRLVVVENLETPLDEHRVWHEDVIMYTAWDVDDETPSFLGYVYFDLFPREGKKTHAGHYPLRRRYQKPDGSWQQPCSCLVMNYIKPTTSRPTLLGFDNARTLFHELGHMYHYILSRSKYATLNSVDVDFVETPSMMLEQFFWQPEIVHQVSFHYSYISEAMREVWLNSLPGGREANAEEEPPAQLTMAKAIELAKSNTRENIPLALDLVFFSTYDLLIHSPATHEDLVQMNLCESFNRLRTEIYQIPGGEAVGDGWEFGQGQTVFKAIQGKYDAGYYAYLLGRLFGLNMFEAGFADDPLSKKNGRRFRDMVLCKGGSQPEMKTMVDYLGREPSTKVYLRWLGIE